MPRVLVLTFTRALTEFIKTGCIDSDGAELFPRSAISTYAAWIKDIYEGHEADLPALSGTDLVADRIALAKGALGLVKQGKFPLYDALFVDEAQDLVPDEVHLLREWAKVLFFVADKRQHIFSGAHGMGTIEQLVGKQNRHVLKFHYRLAPEICTMADKILTSQSGDSLSSTEHYVGPKPGEIRTFGPAPKNAQLAEAGKNLKLQIRAYGDLIAGGDRLGVIVAKKAHRQEVLESLEAHDSLSGKCQIVRARELDEDSDYSPTLDPGKPILILTAAACKGLEFRAAHWLFCDEGNYHFKAETYYTVVTRAKTRLDMYFEKSLPARLAAAYAPPLKPW